MLSELQVRELRAQAVDLDNTGDIINTIDYILGDTMTSPLEVDEEELEDTEVEDETEDDDNDDDDEENEVEEEFEEDDE